MGKEGASSGTDITSAESCKGTSENKKKTGHNKSSSLEPDADYSHSYSSTSHVNSKNPIILDSDHESSQGSSINYVSITSISRSSDSKSGCNSYSNDNKINKKLSRSNSDRNIDNQHDQNKARKEKENLNKRDTFTQDCSPEKQDREFRVAKTDTEFKLRIVPLEKLLEKPMVQKPSSPPKSESKVIKEHQIQIPEGTNRSVIDISDCSNSVENEEVTLLDKVEYSAETKISKSRLENRTITNFFQETSTSVPTLTTPPKDNQEKEDKKNNNENNCNSSIIGPYKIKRCFIRLRRARLLTLAKISTGEIEPARKGQNRKMNASTATSVSMAAEKPTNSRGRSRPKKVLSETEESDLDLNQTEGIENSDDEDDSDFEVNNAFVNAADEKDDSDNGKPIRKGKGTDKARNTKTLQDGSDTCKSSDSEVMPVRKRRVFNKRKRTSSNDSDFEPQQKVTKKKRGRIEKQDSDDSGDEHDDENNKNKRKHIRKIIKTKDLDISTKTATKEEEERRKRIEERQKLYNQFYEKPESAEVTELVLDFDEETKEPLLEVDKGLLKKLKPHQVAGVKFMWDACYETLKDTEDKPGSGCILAHCMGLGKTLQVVTLSHTLLINASRTGIERVLIISPLSTLNNWAREFKHWTSFARKRKFEIYDMSKFRDKLTRIFKLTEWFEEGGVCILGYDMYRILANEKAKGLKKKQRESLQKALVDPGPDMVVCDEGHLLKNEKTSISKAVTKMRTLRRIVLTGTPLQNNLKEYYCMIQFIKPNLLGTYKEYLNRFVNPITNGQYTDSTERDIRLMKHRSHILHKLLEGCIQRRDYSVLAPYLPPKHEYVVYTTLSILQQYLYEYYMTTQRDISSSDIGGKGARLFQDFQDLRRIWTHPMNLRMNSDNVIRKRLLAESDSMDDFIDDDYDDEASDGTSSDGGSDGSSKSFASGNGANGTIGNSRAGRNIKTRNNKSANDSDREVLDEPPEPAEPVEKDDPSEWWKRFVADKELNNINHSPKLLILMRLLEQCQAIGDKLLVFSQSLQSLDVIEHFLSLIDSRTKGAEIEGDICEFKGHWLPGQDYFRLDGSCSVEQREVMCKKFNDVSNLRARLFLISTRAGGLGINLVAANRVVIFDVSWNPSHDTQSIFRVYRFGQDKPCYIYRLIAMGTMEQKIYERQVAKQATAKRVIDEQQISRHYNQSDLLEMYTYEVQPSVEREVPILPKDRLFAELLSEEKNLIFKYHEHDSLLENEESENLSEAERKAAWSEYEAEKTRSVQTAQYMSYDRGAFGSQLGNSSGSVTSNKIFGFRSDVLLQLLNMKISKDQPDLSQNQIIQLVPSYLQRLYNEMNNGDPSMYKDLLGLHGTLAHPSGMYMSPLLYANQNSSGAGYYQAPGMQQQVMPSQSVVPAPMPTEATGARFDPNQVYEID